MPLRGLCGSDESCLGYGVADETARGQHSVLVRALLSSLVGDRWLSIRPMTPEVWLDLSPSHTVLYATSADRQNPSGIQRGVALLVAWLIISRSTT